MVDVAIKEFQKYLSSANKKELFDGPKKISLQVCLHKIPNLKSDKQILCKLPHSLNEEENSPEVCLFVKDIDKKDREYEKTVRKYKALIEKNQLESIVKQVIPVKQLNIEFRPHEAKRKLCTSFDVFIADRCLHDILFNGSKLGKEFRKRRKMPFEVDVEKSANLKESIMDILNSTQIRLTGNGSVIDINAFLSSHSVQQALENINAIKAELFKHLPGGEQNVKSIYLKSTNTLAVPIYVDTTTNANDIKLKNNITPKKIKKVKKMKVKRLEKKAKVAEKKAAKKLPTLIKRKSDGVEAKATTKKIKPTSAAPTKTTAKKSALNKTTKAVATKKPTVRKIKKVE